MIYGVWGDGLIFYTCLRACTGASWSRAVVGRRPTTHLSNVPATTDLFHMLACAHGRCQVKGSRDVGQRPTPEPPVGARMKGVWRPNILVWLKRDYFFNIYPIDASISVCLYLGTVVF